MYNVKCDIALSQYADWQSVYMII